MCATSGNKCALFFSQEKIKDQIGSEKQIKNSQLIDNRSRFLVLWVEIAGRLKSKISWKNKNPTIVFLAYISRPCAPTKRITIPTPPPSKIFYAMEDQPLPVFWPTRIF